MGALLSLKLFFLPYLISCFALPPSVSSSYADNKAETEQKLVFCYFERLKPSPDYTYASCSATTTNGEEYSSVGFTHYQNEANKSENDFDSRLWFFAIPSNSYAVSFAIRGLGSGDAWLETGSYPISSPLFVLNVGGYSMAGGSAYWGEISITYTVFAEYVLSWINPYSSSPITGYNAFPQINDGIYSHILDSAKPEDMVFDDPYLGQTNVEEKWKLIKDNYEANAPAKQSNAFNAFCIIFGIALLFLALGLLVPTAVITYKRGKAK